MLGLENGGAGTVIQPRWRRNNLLTGLNYRYH
jgi:hypothetical protein